MAVSLRSNTHLGTTLLLQARLGHISIIAVEHRPLFYYGESLLRFQRKAGADSHDFSGLCSRVVQSTHASIGSGQPLVGNQVVRTVSEVFLKNRDRFFIPPHV